MAIAGVWHCENMADRVVDSFWFQTVITKARLDVSDSKIQIQKQVGSELLDHNYNSCNDQNLVDFTASFNAPTTFAYFNSKAASKYRISPAEVKIIDLARIEKLGNHNGPQVIIITSK